MVMYEKQYERRIRQDLRDDDVLECMVYGVIDNKLNEKKVMLRNKRSVAPFNYCIVAIINNDIYIYELDRDYRIVTRRNISRKNIESLSFNNCMFGLGRKLRLKYDDSTEIEIKCMKKVSGMKSQKENLKKLELSMQEIVFKEYL